MKKNGEKDNLLNSNIDNNNKYIFHLKKVKSNFIIKKIFSYIEETKKLQILLKKKISK